MFIGEKKKHRREGKIIKKNMSFNLEQLRSADNSKIESETNLKIENELFTNNTITKPN